MNEKLSQSPEQHDKSPEQLEKAGKERFKELNEQLERRAEASKEVKNPRQLEEEARLEAAKAERKAAKEVVPAEKRKDTPLPRAAREKASFNRTMKEARSHMSAPSKAFSKVIHNKTVEKTSEVVGSTVARPNAILSGSVAAFLFTLIIYLVARYYGYPLSGFETIGAFIFGWLVGNLIDYLRLMITGRKA